MEVCGLSKVTGTMFLEMQMAAEFLMHFFQRFEHHKRNAIHLRCVGVEAEKSLRPVCLETKPFACLDSIGVNGKYDFV